MSYKHCIINFSDSNANYLHGQQRLVKSLHDQHYQGDIITFNSHEQLSGCRPHSEIPYGFKTHCIEHARKLGYDVVLYVDASIWAIRNVMPCLDHIYNRGYLFEHSGFFLSDWCNDYSLEKFGISREQAKDYPMFSAGFTGLNLKHEKGGAYFEQWHKYSCEGDTFKGDWSNHRHDQCSGSFIARTLGMKVENPHFMRYYYNEPMQTITEPTIFLAQGV